MNAFFCINAGQYRIGDDSLPQASPAHTRTLSAPVWVSHELVNWSQYEAFVVAGGYTPQLITQMSKSVVGKDQEGKVPGFSVDRRVEQLLGQALPVVANSLGNVPAPTLPITGLTWFEAQAVSSFLGGRLPYEIEWEVTQLNLLSKQPIRFQEWTLDTYAKYWRADGQRRGQPWTPQAHGSISIRGARPNDHIRSIAQRIGDAPWNVEGYRGFRIAWDAEPAA